jgi:hypothetical protein
MPEGSGQKLDGVGFAVAGWSADAVNARCDNAARSSSGTLRLAAIADRVPTVIRDQTADEGRWFAS